MKYPERVVEIETPIISKATRILFPCISIALQNHLSWWTIIDWNETCGWSIPEIKTKYRELWFFGIIYSRVYFYVWIMSDYIEACLCKIRRIIFLKLWNLFHVMCNCKLFKYIRWKSFRERTYLDARNIRPCHNTL